MQFLKTLLWVLLAVVIVIFAMGNWTDVSVAIGSQLMVDSKLGPLIVAAFLVGFLPLYLVHRAQVWRLRRRIASLEVRTAPSVLPASAGSVASQTAQPASTPSDPAQVPPA